MLTVERCHLFFETSLNFCQEWNNSPYIPMTKGAMSWYTLVEYAIMTKKVENEEGSVSIGTTFDCVGFWVVWIRELIPGRCYLGVLPHTLCLVFNVSFQYYLVRARVVAWRVDWFLNVIQLWLTSNPTQFSTRTNQNGRRCGWSYSLFVITTSWTHITIGKSAMTEWWNLESWTWRIISSNVSWAYSVILPDSCWFISTQCTLHTILQYHWFYVLSWIWTIHLPLVFRSLLVVKLLLFYQHYLRYLKGFLIFGPSLQPIKMSHNMTRFYLLSLGHDRTVVG